MTVRVRKSRRGWWVAGIAVLTVAAVGWQLTRGGDPAGSVPAATVQVKVGDVTSSVAAAGTVQPVAQRELSFAVSGTLTAVNVKPGEQVVPGQVLATIDQADAQQTVNAAADQVAAAGQALREARAAAAAAAATPTCVATTGGDTRAANPQPSATATGQATPPASPAPSSSPTPNTCAGAGSGPNSGGSGRGGDAVYSAEISVNQASLTLIQAQRKLAGTTITAPVAGRVLSVGAKAGSVVGTSTFIALGVVEQMMVQAQFAEADAVTIAVGQQAVVTLASQEGKTFPVTVTQVAAVGTVAERLVRYTVLLTFDQQVEGLLIGQSATATVVLNRSAGVRYLPQSAVRMIGDGSGEVKVAGGVRKVTIGLRGDGDVEILDGLAEHDTVALNARS